MEPAELSTMLKRFYIEARNVEGKPYSRNTMKAIRSGLDRFLSGSPQRKPFSIIRDKVFKPANEALDASLKDLARQGLISSTKHKRPISSEDLEALYAANQLGLDTPESLVNTAWFYTVLYFGKRGRENQRAMKPGDLQLKTTTSGLKYFVLSERATKNHPGGISDNEDESQSVMMAWPGNPRCPVAFLEKYLAKRETQCDALWQKPKNHNASSFYSTDEVWFCNAPMGKHKLENLLTVMCKKAGLAHVYTPHCIRATSVTVLKAAGLENCRVKSVTGHASDKSIESYSARPTIEQQSESSAIVSRFITQRNSVQPSLAAVSPEATSSFSATSSTTMQQRSQQVHQQSTFNVNPSSAPDFSHSVFHGCNFFFSPRSDN